MSINQCPNCNCLLIDNGKLSPLGYRPCVCKHCGHVFMAMQDNGVKTKRCTFADLHEHQDQETRKRIYDHQERTHHRNGHWG